MRTREVSPALLVRWSESAAVEEPGYIEVLWVADGLVATNLFFVERKED